MRPRVRYVAGAPYSAFGAPAVAHGGGVTAGVAAPVCVAAHTEPRDRTVGIDRLDDFAAELMRPELHLRAVPDSIAAYYARVTRLSLALTLAAIGLTTAKTVHNAVLLGQQADDATTQSHLARVILRDHVVCISAIGPRSWPVTSA